MKSTIIVENLIVPKGLEKEDDILRVCLFGISGRCGSFIWKRNKKCGVLNFLYDIWLLKPVFIKALSI